MKRTQKAKKIKSFNDSERYKFIYIALGALKNLCKSIIEAQALTFPSETLKTPYRATLKRKKGQGARHETLN